MLGGRGFCFFGSPASQVVLLRVDRSLPQVLKYLHILTVIVFFRSFLYFICLDECFHPHGEVSILQQFS